MQGDDYKTIKTELIEGERVLDIELHGGRGNIVNMTMMTELRACLAEHVDRPSLRAMLMRGAGGSFSRWVTGKSLFLSSQRAMISLCMRSFSLRSNCNVAWIADLKRP